MPPSSEAPSPTASITTSNGGSPEGVVMANNLGNNNNNGGGSPPLLQPHHQTASFLSTDMDGGGFSKKLMYACTVCQKSYDTDIKLANHMRTHNRNSNAHPCDTCKVGKQNLLFF